MNKNFEVKYRSVNFVVEQRKNALKYNQWRPFFYYAMLFPRTCFVVVVWYNYVVAFLQQSQCFLQKFPIENLGMVEIYVGKVLHLLLIAV